MNKILLNKRMQSHTDRDRVRKTRADFDMLSWTKAVRDKLRDNPVLSEADRQTSTDRAMFFEGVFHRSLDCVHECSWNA